MTDIECLKGMLQRAGIVFNEEPSMRNFHETKTASDMRHVGTVVVIESGFEGGPWLEFDLNGDLKDIG